MEYGEAVQTIIEFFEEISDDWHGAAKCGRELRWPSDADVAVELASRLGFERVV